MKKFISFVCAVAMFFSIGFNAFAIPDADDGVYARSNTYYMSDTNNVRKSTSTSSTVVAKIAKNTAVVDMLDGKNAAWIKPNGYNGYVHRNYCVKDCIPEYNFCVANKSAKIYMNARLIEPVVSMSVGDAIWATGTAFMNSNGVFVYPCKTTIGSETYHGFVNVNDFSECLNCYAKIKRPTKLYKYDTGSQYVSTVSSGNYWVLDIDNRVAILKKENGKMNVYYVDKADVNMLSVGIG